MTERNLSAILDQRADRDPGGAFLRFEGDELRFSDFAMRSRIIAGVLEEIGIRKGDRVAVMLRNGFEFPLIWFAIARLGAIIVPVNTGYRDRDLAYILDDSGAKLVVTSHEFLPQILGAFRTLEKSLPICGFGEADQAGWIDLAHETTRPTGGAYVGPDDLLNLQYTSGTTGFPKGCMLSHDYWLTIGQVAARLNAVREGDVNITAQPYYYADPQWNTALALVSPAPLCILPRFSASTFMESVRKTGATFFYCVGTMPLMLFKQPPSETDRAHRLRHVYCSGIVPSMHASFERRWGVPWREAFGMTETGVDLVVPLEAGELTGSGVVGRVIETKQVRVLDESGRTLPAGRTGELCVTGRPMMQGYWNRPDETRETLRDGWLHTGDLASIDEHGWVQLHGRIKDMIRRGGENIAASEVEAVISEHPEVTEVAVLAVADDVRGEEVAAVINADPEKLSPQDLRAFLEPRLARFKLPRFVAFVDRFEKTPSERIEKHRLVEHGRLRTPRFFDHAFDRWIEQEKST